MPKLSMTSQQQEHQSIKRPSASGTALLPEVEALTKWYILMTSSVHHEPADHPQPQILNVNFIDGTLVRVNISFAPTHHSNLTYNPESTRILLRNRIQCLRQDSRPPFHTKTRHHRITRTPEDCGPDPDINGYADRE
jgi:hypothetical protein